MRAFAVRSFGEAPAIHDLLVPSSDAAFLIRVKCAGVNPIDYKLVERLTAASTYPFVVGMDFAGIVERVPAGQRDFHAGDRIFGMARVHGAYAETQRSHRAFRQNLSRAFPMVSVTSRQPRCLSRQLPRSDRSSCSASPRVRASS